MADTPAHPGPDDPTSEFEPIAPEVESPKAAEPAPDEAAGQQQDPGRFIRTWVWMILVSGFGLFLVFGTVTAHYWDENASGTYYVPVTSGMQVLDIWRAQINGLPDVAHQSILKSVFLVSVFGFIGLSVIALWLATVQIWNASGSDKSDSVDDGSTDSAPDSVPASSASAG